MCVGSHLAVYRKFKAPLSVSAVLLSPVALLLSHHCGITGWCF